MSMPATEVKSLAEIVKERMRGNVASLIPDEVWDQMVEKELNTLVNGQEWFVDPFTGERKQFSPLTHLIKSEIYTMMKGRILEELKDADLHTTYGFNSNTGERILTNERIAAAITIAAPDLMNLMVAKMFSSVAAETLSAIRNGRM